ncbi:ankyrin repeat protein, partial [Wilcoxina mikolae CBS 423.85]
SLLQAATIGDSSEVSSLLLSGADVSAIDRNRQTTLHLTASQGHLEVVRLVLNADAEIDPRMNLGHTPLYLAARSGALDIVQLLVE